MMDELLNNEWKKVLGFFGQQFGEDIDLQGVLFLIGVQELGKGYKKFNKDQKLEVIHVAICTLLEPYGYYEFEGNDKEGWPHWKLKINLPPLKPGQQSELMINAIVEYCKERELI